MQSLMLTKHGQGLQNLYSSVRFRPAPPTQLCKKSTSCACFRCRNRRYDPAFTTGKNGEDAAKRGGPSNSRPTKADFRPTPDSREPSPKRGKGAGLTAL